MITREALLDKVINDLDVLEDELLEWEGYEDDHYINEESPISYDGLLTVGHLLKMSDTLKYTKSFLENIDNKHLHKPPDML